jgi:diguanylate cyclase (GGDEF)-like protein
VANRLQLSEDLASIELLADGELARGVVVMLDIDHFKDLNDSLGHQFGDRTLQRVAGALRSALREGDRLYRYGGEEFLIVFADVTLQEGARLCECVRETIGSLKLDRREGDPGMKITVSLGFATFPTQDGRFAEAIGLADQAMYEAKRMGRNRVAAWDPSHAPRAA